jgi:Ca2+-binding RTX toxin-like protein
MHRSLILLIPSLIAMAGVLACEPRPPLLEDCTIVGTPGDDVLLGTDRDDVICGLGGLDRITAYGGNDTISGGPGRDHINPGIGDDLIFGEGDNDNVSDVDFGQPGWPHRPADKAGNDTAYLGDGNDGAEMGSGNDRVHGGAGADVIRGEDGNDQLYQGVSSSDTLIGGDGHDYLVGDAGWVWMSGGPGDDVMASLSPFGQANVSGGLGNDLAMLIDGSIDSFTAQEDPTMPWPSVGIPCQLATGEHNIQVTCEFLGDIEIGVDPNDGVVTYSQGPVAIAAVLQDLPGSGRVTTDLCICDQAVPGFPNLHGDVLL